MIFDRALECMDRIGEPAEQMFVKFTQLVCTQMLQLGEFSRMHRHLPRAMELAEKHGRHGTDLCCHVPGRNGRLVRRPLRRRRAHGRPGARNGKVHGFAAAYFCRPASALRPAPCKGRSGNGNAAPARSVQPPLRRSGNGPAWRRRHSGIHITGISWVVPHRGWRPRRKPGIHPQVARNRQTVWQFSIQR